MDAEKRKIVVDIWKKVVEVQMHFNDIEMKIRGLFVTIVLALAAAQGFLLDKGLLFSMGQLKVLYATFMPLLGIVAACLFYFMDRYWYHRLLMGAVTQGEYIEKKYAKFLLEVSITEKIGEASPVETEKWTSGAGRLGKVIADWLVTDDEYQKTGNLHSTAKIELFYKSVGYLFLLLFLITVLFVGVLIVDRSLATAALQKLSSGGMTAAE